MSRHPFGSLGPWDTLIGAVIAALVLVVTRAAAWITRRYFPTAEEEHGRWKGPTMRDDDDE